MDFDRINGTLIWYSYICDREVWFIGHSIEPPQENEYLGKGKAIHEIFYQNSAKEVFVDNTIMIDVVRGKELIAELKSSSKHLRSAMMQMAFYLYYLKKEKGKMFSGKVLVPTEKKSYDVKLTDDIEKEIEDKIRHINEILALDKPPAFVKIPFCKNCAYKELCFA